MWLIAENLTLAEPFSISAIAYNKSGNSEVAKNCYMIYNDFLSAWCKNRTFNKGSIAAGNELV